MFDQIFALSVQTAEGEVNRKRVEYLLCSVARAADRIGREHTYAKLDF